MKIKSSRFALAIIGFLIFLNILAWLVVYDLNQPQLLEVIFFDVGQGEATFIKNSRLHQVLIDGGPDSTVLEKLGKELPFWDNALDLIILTHPEKDHLAGLIEVLKRYKVENVLWTGVKRETAEFKEWERLLREEKAKIFIARVGQEIKIPGCQLCSFSILYPFESLEGQEFKDTNNTSLVVKLNFGQNSFLFTGDIYKSVENELLEKGSDIDSDVLKVGHHGSKTSSSEEFIEKVSPEIAVISAGKNNPYGHPHQEVLEVLEKYGIKVLRTDLDGDVKVISDGVSYKIKFK